MIAGAVMVMHFGFMAELHELLIKAVELLQTAAEVNMKACSFGLNNSPEAATIHPIEQKGLLIYVTIMKIRDGAMVWI